MLERKRVWSRCCAVGDAELCQKLRRCPSSTWPLTKRVRKTKMREELYGCSSSSPLPTKTHVRRSTTRKSLQLQRWVITENGLVTGLNRKGEEIPIISRRFSHEFAVVYRRPACQRQPQLHSPNAPGSVSRRFSCISYVLNVRTITWQRFEAVDAMFEGKLCKKNVYCIYRINKWT